MNLQNTSCCGLIEFEDICLSDPEESVLLYCEGTLDEGYYVPFVLFTDIKPYKHAKKLIAYIKKHGLGSIVKTATKKNPNSKHRLKVYVWTVDQRAIKKWYKLNKPYEEDTDEYSW